MSRLDVFSQWQPLDLSKAAVVKSKDGKTYYIKGIASTEHEDQHNEIILQNGLDFSYCLKSGHFNYDHKNDPLYILGAPQKINKVTHKGKAATEIEGILYADKQIVKDLMENVAVMKNTNSGRTLGFSIEGQVLARDNRDPSIVTRAKVLNVSITHTPANPESTVALVKSILSQKETDMKKEYDDLSMSYRQSKMLEDYSEKLCRLLSSLPRDADLPEWCQAKITKALDYLQAAYHYLDVELKEGDLDKDVNPDYLNELGEEAVLPPESVSLPDVGRDDDYRTEANMDKAAPLSLMDYDRYKRFVDMLSKMYDKMYHKMEHEDAKEEDLKELAEEILEEYPELKDEEIMGLVHQLLKDYYSKMSDLSAIQPQSLEGKKDKKELASRDYSYKTAIEGLLQIGMPEDKIKLLMSQYIK